MPISALLGKRLLGHESGTVTTHAIFVVFYALNGRGGLDCVWSLHIPAVEVERKHSWPEK